MDLMSVKESTKKFALEIAADYLKGVRYSYNDMENGLPIVYPVDAQELKKIMDKAGIIVPNKEMAEMLNELMFGKNKIADFRVEQLFPDFSKDGIHFRVIKVM